MFYHVFKKINVNEQKMLEEHVTCSQGDKNRLSWNPRGQYFQVDFK